MYFLNNNKGELIESKTIHVSEDPTIINISKEKIENLGVGANDLKLFALSNSVLKPDFYSTSFLVSNSLDQLPTITKDEIKIQQGEEWFLLWVIPAIIIIGTVIYIKRRSVN